MSEINDSTAPGQLATQLREFIRRNFPVARSADLGDDEPLLESGIVDSLGILELVNYMTGELGVPVSDEDLSPENFQSIASLVRFVEGKRREASGG